MKKGKFEKLRQEWVEAGRPEKGPHTLSTEDFAYWLDQRREAVKPEPEPEQVESVKLPTDWQVNTGVAPDWPDNIHIEVILRDGTPVLPRYVSQWRWSITDSDIDILLYRAYDATR